MGKIIFVAVGLSLLLAYNAKKKGLYSSSSFLIFIYLISSVFCIFDIIINDQTRVLQNKYWPAAIVFLALITGYLIPFIRVNETKWRALRLPSRKVLDVFADIIIALSLFSIFYYITDVIAVFSSGDLSQMREHLTGQNGEYTKTGILNTVASVSASFYDIALLLFFIYFSMGRSKIRRALLIVSSFSYTVQVLTFVGRDGIVFWIFSFIFDFLLFRRFIPKEYKKKAKKLFIIASIIVSIPFFAISVSRFGESDSGTGGGIVSYMGQPLRNWCLYYGMDHRISSPGSGWPLYYEITGRKPPTPSGPWESEGTYSWSFGTFLRSWYDSLGMIGILSIMLFMWIVFYATFRKRRRRLYFHCLFIYILFFEIIAEGVFYFLQYTRGGNLSIVLMFLLCITFSIIERTGRKKPRPKTVSNG